VHQGLLNTATLATRTDRGLIRSVASSFRYEKGYGDHEEADGVKIGGMTVVNCLYVPLQFVYIGLSALLLLHPLYMRLYLL
jgi:hypothetical protein